jgi:TonB family protein
MKGFIVVLLLVLTPPLCAGVFDGYPFGELLQNPPAPPPPPPPLPPQRPELGKWWKNSTVVRKLGLSDTQIKEIEGIFLDHRMKLETLRDKVNLAETQLKPLVEGDRPDEARVMAQMDHVLAARFELEKENTMMMLGIRRVLTLEQWKKLQEVQKRREIPPPPPPAVPTPPAPPAPPKPPEEDPVYVVGKGIVAPVVVYQPIPGYTQEARDAKVDGLVLIQCVIGKDGRVTQVKLMRGLGHGLDEAAMNAVANEWRFKPGTLNGQPVAVRAIIEISFRVERNL